MFTYHYHFFVLFKGYILQWVAFFADISPIQIFNTHYMIYKIIFHIARIENIKYFMR